MRGKAVMLFLSFLFSLIFPAFFYFNSSNHRNELVKFTSACSGWLQCPFPGVGEATRIVMHALDGWPQAEKNEVF